MFNPIFNPHLPVGHAPLLGLNISNLELLIQMMSKFGANMGFVLTISLLYTSICLFESLTLWG